ncbi:hypothetical protein JQC92_19670 [Shewanella sp. 202IG2-18]|uniref:hypothetical protein n=1 Tax=Parashewanella hymeniacidonis TaxID=2807618 RepID=UPI00195FAF07|nr:hypothetical protein [Parashewanella hymeniacidonis]MBM7074218.1 hypothetical protein [Parashewanella hymeniacidonis]
MKIIEYFVLTFLWCGVAISPTLLGGIIGAVVGNSNGLLVETIYIPMIPEDARFQRECTTC